MKKNLKIAPLLSVIFSFFLITAACKKDKQEEVSMEVAPKPIKAMTWGSSTPTDHLHVKENGEDWRPLSMGAIEGFTYVTGNHYVLKVRKYKIDNPPMDASSVGYRLIRVVSEKKIE